MAGVCVWVLMTAATQVAAATVTGVLTGYESAAPISHHDLHFENQKTLDIYMTSTNAQGQFGAELPPGVYEVRGDHGAILVHGIIVGRAPVTIGSVNELAPYTPTRLFERQVITPSLLYSAAPSTAPIMTRDTTPPPAGVVRRRLNPAIAIENAMTPNELNPDINAPNFEGNCLGSPCSKQPVPQAPSMNPSMSPMPQAPAMNPR